MRKVRYLCASSLDGFIASKAGRFDDFLMEGPHVADYMESLQSFDVALMGRKTYEVGLELGVSDPYPFLKTYVFSRTMTQSPDPKVTLVNGDASAHVRELKQLPGKDIWLAGAGELAATLFAEGLVDELSIKVNPMLMGDGIPVVARLARTAQLELFESKVYPNGVALLSYRVK
jgi:dihydrofolate reductase